MHYGHPDFVDAFWARNRGGMSVSPGPTLLPVPFGASAATELRPFQYSSHHLAGGKSSPVVNLSEDIFAGYNVRMSITLGLRQSSPELANPLKQQMGPRRGGLTAR